MRLEELERVSPEELTDVQLLTGHLRLHKWHANAQGQHLERLKAVHAGLAPELIARGFQHQSVSALDEQIAPANLPAYVPALIPAEEIVQKEDAMPWTIDNPPPPAENWSAEKKRVCVETANAVLREGGTEEQAIQACIRNVEQLEKAVEDVKAVTRTDGGQSYTSGAYLYVPDAQKPSTWKLRIEESPSKVTVAQLGRAAAALGPGFRGQRVELPAEDRTKAAKKLISLYRGQDVADGDIPDYLWGIANVAAPKAEEAEEPKAEKAGTEDFQPTFTYQRGWELLVKTAPDEQIRLAFPTDLAKTDVTKALVEPLDAGDCDIVSGANLHEIQFRGKHLEGTYSFSRPEGENWQAVRPRNPKGGVMERFGEMWSILGQTMENWLTRRPEKESGLWTVKQKDGRYRWLAITSTAVQDKEEEIVSRAAMDMAVEKADEVGEHGVLDFWHTDVLLGECDFQAREGLCLIESGLYDDNPAAKQAAKTVEANPDAWALSILLLYNPKAVERRDGLTIYNDIVIPRRALLPRGKEAARFTQLFTGGESMDKQKESALLELCGGNADMVRQMLTAAAAVEAKADEQNLVTKGAGSFKKTLAGLIKQVSDPDLRKKFDALLADYETPAGEIKEEVPPEEAPTEELPEEQTSSDLLKQIEELREKVESLEEKPAEKADPILEALKDITNRLARVESAEPPRQTTHRASQDKGTEVKESDNLTEPGKEFGVVADIVHHAFPGLAGGK